MCDSGFGAFLAPLLVGSFMKAQNDSINGAFITMACAFAPVIALFLRYKSPPSELAIESPRLVDNTSYGTFVPENGE